MLTVDQYWTSERPNPRSVGLGILIWVKDTDTSGSLQFSDGDEWIDVVGASELTDGLTLNDLATPSAPGADKMVIYPRDDVLYMRSGAAGSETAFLTTTGAQTESNKHHVAPTFDDYMTIVQGAAPSAPSTGMTSLYGTTFGDLGLVVNGESATRFIFDSKNFNVTNVKMAPYGAKGDGSTNDTAAIQAAYDAIPASGGILYFPPGSYRFTALSFTSTKAVFIVGAGPYASFLVPTVATGNSITISGLNVLWGIQDIGITPSVARNEGTYLVAASTSFACWVNNIYSGNTTGGQWSFTSINQVYMAGVTSTSSNGTTGDTALRLNTASGTFTNCQFRSGGTAIARSPTVWLGGGNGTNSLRFSNCIFSGQGYRATATISSAVDSGGTFTIATQTVHGLAVNDLIAIRDVVTDTDYNNAWRVASISDTSTFVVTSAGTYTTISPGQGTVQSIAAAFYVENDGTYNESVLANCLTTNVAVAPYGTAGYYFDAKRGANEINGWNLTGCWYDGGAIGCLISGKGLSGAPSCYGFSITGGHGSQVTRMLHLDQVSGVTVSDLHAGLTANNYAPTADGIGPACGAYIFAGASPASQGINFANCNLGMPRDAGAWSVSTIMTYGVYADGQVNTLTVTGGILAGSTAPLGFTDITAAQLKALIWKIKPGIASTAIPFTAASTMPTLASAATITPLIGFDTYHITGATAIDNIANAYHGRELTLLTTSNPALNAGGNPAIAAARTTAAGDMVNLKFSHVTDLWYAR